MGGARSVGGVAASSASAGTRSAAATVTRPELRDLYPPLFEGVVLVVWIGCMVPVVSGLLATYRDPPAAGVGCRARVTASGGTDRLLGYALWVVTAGLLVVFAAYLFAATRTASRAGTD